jgi:hypothetical protein
LAEYFLDIIGGFQDMCIGQRSQADTQVRPENDNSGSLVHKRAPFISRQCVPDFFHLQIPARRLATVSQPVQQPTG